MTWFSGWEASWSLLCRPSRQARWEPWTAEEGVQPAEADLPYAPTVPWSHWAASGDPGVARGGRGEMWTAKTLASGIPGKGKGLNPLLACHLIMHPRTTRGGRYGRHGLTAGT